MSQTSEVELAIRSKSGFKEAAEECRRSGSVKTVVVVKDSYPHEVSIERGKTFQLALVRVQIASRTDPPVSNLVKNVPCFASMKMSLF